MKKFFEKVSVLALSSMLVSAFSVSSALPLMVADFPDYSAGQLELLISVPSFSVLLVLLANSLLTRYLKERQMIVAGLLTMSLAGIVPVFVQDYWLILLSRMCFGVGTGLINAKAVSMVSERYTGRERIQMLGFRGSSEVVGSAFLTLLVGQLIKIDWSYAFAIYGAGFLILLLYLCFVPQLADKGESPLQEQKESLPKALRLRSLALAFFAGWNVCISSSISLRVPLLVTTLNLGTASDASLVLSAYQLVGILSGLAFAPLLKQFGSRLLGLSYLGLALSVAGLALSNHLLPLGLAALGAGFINSVLMTAIFHQLSEEIPARLLNSATALVLIGCNLGGALAPSVMSLMGLVADSYLWLFGFFAASCLLIASLLLLGKEKKENALG